MDGWIDVREMQGMLHPALGVMQDVGAVMHVSSERLSMHPTLPFRCRSWNTESEVSATLNC